MYHIFTYESREDIMVNAKCRDVCILAQRILTEGWLFAQFHATNGGAKCRWIPLGNHGLDTVCFRGTFDPSVNERLDVHKSCR